LIAVGFVAIFTVSEVINLAQGEFAALAGLVAISAVDSGMPLPVALVVAIATVTVVAVVMERVTVAPVKRLTSLTSIILTLGVSTALKALMLLILGAEPRASARFRVVTSSSSGSPSARRSCGSSGSRPWSLPVVWWFYEGTIVGKALRACSEQPIAARLVGISPKLATMLAFGIAGLVGAIAE